MQPTLPILSATFKCEVSTTNQKTMQTRLFNRQTIWKRLVSHATAESLPRSDGEAYKRVSALSTRFQCFPAAVETRAVGIKGALRVADELRLLCFVLRDVPGSKSLGPKTWKQFRRPIGRKCPKRILRPCFARWLPSQ
jgi:hypothetical protein